MMKGLIFHQQQQQQQQQLLDENMSNLTSQSGTELASVSSGNIRAEANYQAQAQAQPPAKKKRNLPGNPGSLFLSIFTSWVVSFFYSKNVFVVVVD